jgi:hypothetical protein
MKKNQKKLVLKKISVARLQKAELTNAKGAGVTQHGCSWFVCGDSLGFCDGYSIFCYAR